MQKIFLVIGLVATILVFAACGSGDSSPAPAGGAAGGRATNVAAPAVPQSAPMPLMEADMETSWDYSATNQVQARVRRIIQTAHVEMHTADRFDEVADALRYAATGVGGFVENSNLNVREFRNQQLRTLSITLRVPAEYFDSVLFRVESLATVTSTNQSAEDVTAEFYDMLSRLETRRIEEERVLAFIEQAENINDLLALEERLGQIRRQIEQYTARINNLDQLATFSTIHVRLSEREEEVVIAPTTLGGRISVAFLGSVNAIGFVFQEFVIFMAGALIPLSVLALMIFAGLGTVKTIKRRASENLEKETV